MYGTEPMYMVSTGVHVQYYVIVTDKQIHVTWYPDESKGKNSELKSMKSSKVYYILCTEKR